MAIARPFSSQMSRLVFGLLVIGQMGISRTCTGRSVRRHRSNINEVPLPAAVWLFGTGLLGLAGIARRRNQAEAA